MNVGRYILFNVDFTGAPVWVQTLAGIGLFLIGVGMVLLIPTAALFILLMLKTGALWGGR